MKRTTLLLLPLFFLSAIISSCSKKIVEKTEATIELKYEMKEGINGMAVAYNPEKKLYYAALGGKTSYPMEVFDKNGKRLSGNKLNIDVRGVWWNNELKQLEANTYRRKGESTVLVLRVDENGNFNGDNISITNENIQPNRQAVGVYDFKNKHLLFYSYGKVYKVNRASLEKIGNIKLQLPVSSSNITQYSLIYTGFPNKEVGVLDYKDKKVYLFNVNTGEHTHTVSLPSDAVTNSAFRFSYSNGYVWLHNTDTRSWKGYKIIK